jgi:hypothetical protein
MRAVCVIALVVSVLSAAVAQDSLGVHRVADFTYWASADDIQMVGNLVDHRT